MAYANFPPAGYLSSGDRTDAQMQTSLEQWRTACQHTTGHGECQLSYVSGNQLVLLSFGGNRMILTQRGYSIPQTGLFLNTTGSVYNLTYVFLIDTAGDLSNVSLLATPIAAPWGRYRHPESGHEILTYSGAGDERAALVGLCMTGRRWPVQIRATRLAVPPPDARVWGAPRRPRASRSGAPRRSPSSRSSAWDLSGTPSRSMRRSTRWGG